MIKVFGFTVRDIAEIAIFCAIAIVLDRFIRIGVGATGGSINISMLPLYIIALRHGPFKGFIAGGVIFGFITCIFDGYGLLCYPLEYFITFGSVAILGFAANYINNLSKKYSEEKNIKHILQIYFIVIISIILCSIIRFFCGSIDSVILWEYSWDAAFLYQLSYIPLSSLAVAIILCILLPSVLIMNKNYPTDYLN